MGADESNTKQQQSNVQVVTKSINHSYFETQNPLQFSSQYKRKNKIFQKEEKVRPASSNSQSDAKGSLFYDRISQKNVRNPQISADIHNFQRQNAQNFSQNFRQQEIKLVKERIKLRKQAKADLQMYMLGDPEPITKYSDKPEKTRQNTLKSRPQQQCGQRTQQTNFKNANHKNSINIENVSEARFKEYHHLKDPELLRIKGSVVSYINPQEYQITTNSVDSEKRKQINNSIPKSNFQIWKIKERLQNVVLSQNQVEMYNINSSLISVPQTQNLNDIGMFELKNTLNSLVQAQYKNEDGMYQIKNPLVSSVEK